MTIRTLLVPALATGLLLLAACGGGGSTTSGIETTPPVAYSNPVSPRYSYDPYEWYSHKSTYSMSNGNRHMLIGGDYEPRQILHYQYNHYREFRTFMGPSRDGEGLTRLLQYAESLAEDDGDLLPFTVQPSLYLDPALYEPENAAIYGALYDSVDILNDALPPEFQIRWQGQRDPDVLNAGDIVVSLVSPQRIAQECSASAEACAFRWTDTARTRTVQARIYIPDDYHPSQYTRPRSVIVHELLHALGIYGHVESNQFPDSLMGTSGQQFPNSVHIIGRTDREILQAMYMSQLPELYSEWGEWADVAYHVMAESEDETMSFGVALFNGLPQPWVRGAMPDTALAGNTDLSGTATWEGILVGFSGPSAIGGNVELQVGLSTLSNPDNEQDLRFRDIYYKNRWLDIEPDAGVWFPARNIDYKVNVYNGNWFRNVRGDGYEQGFVQGAFLGAEHQHMGGTVKRTDMVAAFGGSREE